MYNSFGLKIKFEASKPDLSIVLNNIKEVACHKIILQSVSALIDDYINSFPNLDKININVDNIDMAEQVIMSVYTGELPEFKNEKDWYVYMIEWERFNFKNITNDDLLQQINIPANTYNLLLNLTKDPKMLGSKLTKEVDPNIIPHDILLEIKNGRYFLENECWWLNWIKKYNKKDYGLNSFCGGGCRSKASDCE